MYIECMTKTPHDKTCTCTTTPPLEKLYAKVLNTNFYFPYNF